MIEVICCSPMEMTTSAKLVLPCLDGSKWRNQVLCGLRLVTSRSQADCGFNMSTVRLLWHLLSSWVRRWALRLQPSREN